MPNKPRRTEQTYCGEITKREGEGTFIAEVYDVDGDPEDIQSVILRSSYFLEDIPRIGDNVWFEWQWRPDPEYHHVEAWTLTDDELVDRLEKRWGLEDFDREFKEWFNNFDFSKI